VAPVCRALLAHPGWNAPGSPFDIYYFFRLNIINTVDISSFKALSNSILSLASIHTDTNDNTNDNIDIDVDTVLD